MSDSLRDQLLKAGFEATEKAPAKSKRSQQKSSSRNRKNTRKTGRNKASAGDVLTQKPSPDMTLAEVEALEARQRKAVKGKIKELIEAESIKDFKGTEAYAFMVGTRVRQLFVKADIRTKLSNGELLITRLNGSAHLVPADTAKKILELNPQWAVFDNQDKDKATNDDADDYGDYQVPDDLIW